MPNDTTDSPQGGAADQPQNTTPRAGGIPSLGGRVSLGQPPLVQTEGARPIIENAGLPQMAKEVKAQAAVPAGSLLMPAEPKSAAIDGPRMTAVPAGSGTPKKLPESFPEQKGIAGLAGGQTKESYVRLRLSVDDQGKVSVLGTSEVPGPLADPEPLHGGLAYEVTVGSQHLAVGSIPDPGVRRAFPPQKETPEVSGHFVVPVPSYEFTARVPRAALSTAALPNLHVAVYRLDGSQVIQPVIGKPLQTQFPHLVQEVARLPGIQVKELDQTIQTDLRRIFR